MLRLILRWILSAIALLLVDWLVPGFVVRNFAAALIAALVIGLLNATLGLLLKIITLPLSILTLGLFFLVINAIILKLASGMFPALRWRPSEPPSSAQRCWRCCTCSSRWFQTPTDKD